MVRVSLVELDLIVSVDALVGAGHVVELPAVGLIALIFEHLIVPVEVF